MLVLVVQRDLGTALLYFGLFLVMLYVATGRSSWIILGLGLFLAGGFFASLALYLLLVSRGFRIGFAGQDDFGRLLGVGLSFVIALQVFVVIGGVTRVIPLTGLTTPFLAAGGSSLVANWIIAALLLRLSDSVRNHPQLVVDESESPRSSLVVGQ
jgi:cell division protein FtsW (lipid II flippase)